MPELILKTLLSYLFGSISGSMIMGRFRQVDIRRSGSGNAGGTNAFRTQGFWFALGVVIIDIGKGVLAAGVVPGISTGLAGPAVATEIQVLVCGFAAVVGHCYPVWYGFRGGKGAATAVGALAVIQPWALVPMIATWLLVLVASGWVGLSTIAAAISLVPAFIWLDASQAGLVFAVLLAGFVVFMHRSNIRKIISGQEYRFQRIWFRNWFR